MSDYRYIDVDSIYTNQQTGVLRNLADIDDYESLVFFESAYVAKHIQELRIKPLKIKNSSSLFEIHRRLFQEVYQWAGEKRKVEISKNGRPFISTNSFNSALLYIDSLLFDYRKIAKNDKFKLAEKLADILDAVNFMHPFRERNGRTQREFIRLLALEKGYTVNLNPANNMDIYERYMKGTSNGDIEVLKQLIFEIME